MALNQFARPGYISADWFRCTQGMAFEGRPPECIRNSDALTSANLWERVACVALQAQDGHFTNVAALLDVIRVGEDVHLRDCAVRLFALAAPPDLVGELKMAFDHPSYETRIEAYRAASLTGSLLLAEALVARRRETGRDERDLVMDNISDILEPDGDNIALVDNILDDDAFERRATELVSDLRTHAASSTAFYQGRPLDASVLIADVARLCARPDWHLHGGTMAGLLCLLEAMTGVSYAGCLDNDCSPVMQKVSDTLSTLRQTIVLDTFEPGRRYFFRHLISVT